MKTSLSLTLVVLIALSAVVLGTPDVAAQCGTTAGCGDANCGMCSAAAAGTAIDFDLGSLTADELKLVNHLADLVEKNKQVIFDVAAFAEATGLSEETIMNIDQDRIEHGLLAELERRGFDTSAIAFGSGNCGEFGACSVDANLAGASGDVLAQYQSEKDADGRSYENWPAPDFTLPSTDGREVSLSDFSGRPVAVALLATHCNHCVETMPMIGKLREKYGDKIEFLPVVTNGKSVDAVAKWAKSVDADYPLLVSTDKSVTEAFKTELVPTIVLIDRNGNITKKLVTFKDQSSIEAAFEELIASGGNVASGSR
ncbi:MAG: redoxin family protein [Candidatus Krumholzibacteriota bacterium]|nr:redoxin family protein [Candidatus Krumholzibacteriota bacterium]